MTVRPRSEDPARAPCLPDPLPEDASAAAGISHNNSAAPQTAFRHTVPIASKARIGTHTGKDSADDQNCMDRKPLVLNGLVDHRTGIPLRRGGICPTLDQQVPIDVAEALTYQPLTVRNPVSVPKRATLCRLVAPG